MGPVISLIWVDGFCLDFSFPKMYLTCIPHGQNHEVWMKRSGWFFAVIFPASITLAVTYRKLRCLSETAWQPQHSLVYPVPYCFLFYKIKCIYLNTIIFTRIIISWILRNRLSDSLWRSGMENMLRQIGNLFYTLSHFVWLSSLLFSIIYYISIFL